LATSRRIVVDDLNWDTVREAWRNASSDAVVRALNSPDDYAPGVFAILREEADRRGLDANSDEALVPPVFEHVRRAMGHARNHPFVSGMILGVLEYAVAYCAFRIVPGPGYVLATLIALTFLGLVCICWPLRKYRAAILTPLAVILSQDLLGKAVYLYSTSAGLGPPPLPARTILWIWLVNDLVFFGGFCGPLVAAVFVRNRYWPVYEPGYCGACGYNLRGLPEPRCPECGTPFDPVVEAQDASAEL